MIRNISDHNETVKPNDFELDRLRTALPEYFDSNGNFMIDRLQQALQDGDVDLTREGYEMKFLGKSYAKYLTSTKTETVVVPDLEHNSKPENADSENLYIVGDNLDALKHLLSSYAGKIKCIYIDPPYNTGSDGFVYNDDFGFTAPQLVEKVGLTEDEAERVLDLRGKSSHSAWLTFMYPRLQLGKELLADDGVIFISIDNNEHANLRMVCDEVLGEENFIESLVWNKRIPKNDKGVGSIHEYVLIYTRNASFRQSFTMRKEGLEGVFDLTQKLKRSAVDLSEAERQIKLYYKKNQLDRGITLYNSLDENYRLWGKINMSWPNGDTFGPQYEVLHPITGRPVSIPDRGWRWKYETFCTAAGLKQGRYKSVEKLHDGSYRTGNIWFGKDESIQPSSISYLDELSTLLLRSIQSTKSDGGVELERLMGGKSVFSYPKPTALLRTLLGSVEVNDGDFFIDFFAGSSTSAHAALELNADDEIKRRFISIQLDESTGESSVAYKAGYRTIDSVGRERITRAAAKIKEETDADIDYGFKLYRLNEPSGGVLDDLLTFEPEQGASLLAADYVSKFDRNGTPGHDTVLATWLVEDGHGLTAVAQKVALAGYELDVCGDSAYIISPGLASDDVMELVRLLENGDLAVSRVVVFGYSVTFGVMHELKKNLSVLKSGRTVSVIERL
ncbi:site-specific DNA-methyltransferase [Corynebacterium sp. Marseille-P3884]|uniref:site-specific DNA-methyltransferase n=1 Tax=Corynebacterium sp. Marseille-P3884 TaxID=2495409 RepID=UPI001B339F6A|nr:site-specific DNA-methyltransferase [Corynebacterium sp. Marseille-P3884]MBP3949175.1 site-specific DNA-methyltransferase [Corynebacterium sp. Marseille-P3884]